MAAYRGVFRTKPNEGFFEKILNDFKLLIIFCKKTPSMQMF